MEAAARRVSSVAVTFEWRGRFSNSETNALHAEAFGTRLFDEAEWNWEQQVVTHSLGWVVARDVGELLGFLNVIWDGVPTPGFRMSWSPSQRAA